MITEDYVSFEIAKLLKEKGFDEGCSFVVNTISKGLMPVSWPTTNSDLEDEETNLIALPTLQMAMKWLREVHNLYIDIRININNSLYSFKIYSVGISDARAFTEYRIKSYEEAVEAAIKYCLNKLI